MEYDCGDIRRIKHLIKVYGYAVAIGRLEGLHSRELETLEASDGAVRHALRAVFRTESGICFLKSLLPL